MHDGSWGFLGMHLFWWLFWAVLLFAFFSLATPMPRRRARETPFEILQRRYAAGEISTGEYEERKALLVKDQSPIFGATVKKTDPRQENGD